jgi:ribonuclease J
VESLAPAALKPGVLRIIPLGGIGEIGRNMTVFELDGQIMILDCGVLFPEETQPGVDLILPDFGYLEDKLRITSVVCLTYLPCEKTFR